MESVRPAGIDVRLAHIAERQYGLLTRAQALEAGATTSVINRRIAAGRWERIHGGVYTFAGVPKSWRQHLLAAYLRGVVASHNSSAALWGLPSYQPHPLTITVARGRGHRFPGLVAHEMPLREAEIATVSGIPTTATPRTLSDLAATDEPVRVEVALDDALRRRLTSLRTLRRYLDSAGPRRGNPLLRDLLDICENGIPRSVLETNLLQFLRAIGLPPPVCQYEVRDGPDLIAIIDFAYPDIRLAVEADGRWHAGVRSWENDLGRGNRLLGLGWRVVHVSSTALKTRPKAVESQLRRAFAAP